MCCIMFTAVDIFYAAGISMSRNLFNIVIHLHSRQGKIFAPGKRCAQIYLEN